MKIFQLLFILGLMLIPVRALSQQPKTKVTLGIKPDYWYTMDGTGVRLNGVVKDETAQKAGMREGDIIVALNGHKVKNIFAYRDMLNTYSPGDKVKVTVLRDKKTVYFNVRF